MKKIVFLLMCCFLITTGCSTLSNNDSIEHTLDVIMGEKNHLYNSYFEGYKYYVPKGLKFVTKDDYNATFKDLYNNKYYLYVDLISYYHKSQLNYKSDNTTFFSKKVNYHNNDGYLSVTEENDKYYVRFVYNYARIEVYTSKNHLNDVISNCSTILNSIKYNSKVINSLVGDNRLDYKEESYSLFKSKSDKDTFLDYEKTYDNKNENEDVNRVDVKDDDQLELNTDSES